MNQSVHDIIIDHPKHLVGRPPGKHDKLGAQQGHKDHGSLHSLQVHVGFWLMSLPHLVHKHSDDIEQKEEIDLQDSYEQIIRYCCVKYATCQINE